MSRLSRLNWVSFGSILGLTMLIFAISPLTRGFRFASDDLNFLYQAWANQAEPFWTQLFTRYNVDAPTRSLVMWPFVLATATGSTVIVLQGFYAVVWILNALAAHRIASLLLPNSRFFALAAGCLAASATSDWHTGSLVYGPHLLGVALFAFGIAEMLRSLEQDARFSGFLIGAVLFAVSSFTVEYTFPVVPFLPLLYCVHRGSWRSPRVWAASIVTALAFLPAAGALLSFLRHTSGYAASVVLAPLPLPQRLELAFHHVLCNFTPWQWALRRIPPWEDNYEHVLSKPVILVGIALAAILVLLSLKAITPRPPSPEPVPGRKLAWLAGVLVILIVAANLGTAQIGGEYYVRSQFVSRIFASILIAAGLAFLGSHVRKWMAVLGLTGLVALGVAGGLERHDFNLGYALHERRELESIRKQVPQLREGGHLLLIQPPRSPSVLAVTNPNTLAMVYGDDKMLTAAVVAPNSLNAYSTILGTPEGLIRILVNSSQNIEIDPATAVILFYSISQSRFVLLHDIPAGLLRGSKNDRAYQPDQWIEQGTHQIPAATKSFLEVRSEAWDPPRFKRARAAGEIFVKSDRALLMDILTPYAVEQADSSPLVWLGSGQPDGFSLLVHSPVETTAILSIPVSPGPGRQDPQRTLVCRVDNQRAPRHEQTSSFAGATQLAVSIPLASGDNLVELWIVDQPDPNRPPGDDPRNLMAQLGPISVR